MNKKVKITSDGTVDYTGGDLGQTSFEKHKYMKPEADLYLTNRQFTNINKLVIDYILSNSGQLPENETWYDVGIKCNVKTPNEKRARKSKKYKRRSISREAQRQWQKYLSQKNNLKLDKEIYVNGKLKFETFKNKPEKLKINHDDFEIDAITTSPYGGGWFRLKKKEHFHTEQHLDVLKEILIKEITPVTYNFEDKITNDKGLFIYGADKHIGALTKQGSIYTNKYDKKEIKKRLIINTLCNIKRSVNIFGKLESLFIMDLGDALDGFNQKTIRGLNGTSSQVLSQALDNREQHDTYIEIHKELFDKIVEEKFAKNIYFIATSNSNHGGDFEYGAMRHLETYLNIKYPFIKTVVNYFPLNHFIYGNHAILFGHGKDDEDMKSNMPLNLNDKVENYLNDYIRINNLNKYNVTFVSADLHQSSENYGKSLRYKKVLSQFGSTKWMHTNFGSGSPGLSFEIYEKNTKLIFKTDDFFEIDNQSNTGIDF